MTVSALIPTRRSASSTRLRANRGCPGALVNGDHAVDTSRNCRVVRVGWSPRTADVDAKLSAASTSESTAESSRTSNATAKNKTLKTRNPIRRLLPELPMIHTPFQPTTESENIQKNDGLHGKPQVKSNLAIRAQARVHRDEGKQLGRSRRSVEVVANPAHADVRRQGVAQVRGVVGDLASEHPRCAVER